MTVNGNRYIPLEESLEYERSGTQRLNENGNGYFSIKGGEYGLYKIGFHVNNLELADLTGDKGFAQLQEGIPIIFAYVNGNWWHITNMNLNANLAKENGVWVIKLSTSYTESTEDGSIPVERHVEQKFNYFDEAKKGEIETQIGP